MLREAIEKVAAEAAEAYLKSIAGGLVSQLLPELKPHVRQLVREEIDWYIRHDPDTQKLLGDRAWDLAEEAIETKYPVEYQEATDPTNRPDPVERIIERVEARLIEMISDKAASSVSSSE